MTLSPISPRETSVARSEARRLVAGRGKFIDNITLPGLLYLSFVRSPIAHGLIKNVEIEQANTMPGVARVMTASDYAPLISEIPKTKLETMPGHNSPAQLPLVDRHVRYHGEPVVVIAAETQLQAEDAAAAVNLEYTELPVISDLRSVNFDNDNIASEFKIGPGVPEKTSATHIEAQFSFERQTGVTLEPRGIVVDYDSISNELTVWQSHQSPHLVQVLLARILGMAENRIRVHVGDVGGGFGVKLHLYPDEIAAVLAARLLSMPVKYVATRMESFQSDAQAREFDVTAKISFTEGGELIGMEGDFKMRLVPTPFSPVLPLAIPSKPRFNLVHPIKWKVCPAGHAPFGKISRPVAQSAELGSQYPAQLPSSSLIWLQESWGKILHYFENVITLIGSHFRILPMVDCIWISCLWPIVLIYSLIKCLTFSYAKSKSV